MFESLLPYRQESAVLMSQQISSNVFPRALLLTGERYSAKVHLAMEAARVLSCKHGGANSCSCTSCTAFATYGMANVVYIGNRNHAGRIEAALTLLEELATERARIHLIRTVRLMLLQFHPALQEGKASANFDAASAVNEVLFELEMAPLEALSESALQLRSALKPLYNHLKRSVALSIGQVRRLQEWTMQTSFSDEPRFLILEGIEESTEGARNSLLKLLEEPPKHSYIMVLSEYPSRLLPTILSRLQRHHVRPFDDTMKNLVLSDLFSADGNRYSSIEEFMLEKAAVPCKEISASAERYVDSICNRTELAREELDLMCNELDEAVRLEYFLKQLQKSVQRRFSAKTCTHAFAQQLIQISGEFSQKAFIFNQNGKVLIESLYYRLREVV